MSGEVQVEQRTEAWHAAHAGKITASRMADVLGFSKRDGKPLKARTDYLVELVTERLTGKSIGIPMAPAMQWGVDVEPAARAAYEAKYGVIVQTPGFIVMDCGFIGCSPDGLVTLARDDVGLEIKCPFNTAVHIETLLTGMPEHHIPQLQASMMVTGKQGWDFASYDPRLPPELRLYVQRIERDDGYIADMLKQCNALNDDVDSMVERLQALAEQRRRDLYDATAQSD